MSREDLDACDACGGAASHWRVLDDLSNVFVHLPVISLCEDHVRQSDAVRKQIFGTLIPYVPCTRQQAVDSLVIVGVHGT